MLGARVDSGMWGVLIMFGSYYSGSVLGPISFRASKYHGSAIAGLEGSWIPNFWLAGCITFVAPVTSAGHDPRVSGRARSPV